jgi:hypothetical protein
MGFLGFNGKMRRARYAPASLLVFLSQYVLVMGAYSWVGQRLIYDWRFYAMPLRAIALLERAPVAALPIALALMLLFMWVLGALSFRRAADANFPAWIAAFAMAPIVQLPAILLLWLVPSRVASAAPKTALSGGPDWKVSAQGIVAGGALTVIAVALGALAFGVYGFGMFVIAPLVIGSVTAFLVNRKGDVGSRRTSRTIYAALALGGVALVVGALEGIVCIVMAAPLVVGAAYIGGLFGRSVALARIRTRNSLMSVALVPLVFATEWALPSDTHFTTTESVAIAASPDAIWASIIRMEPIHAPLALPFRLGVAYPLGGQIVGEGVGAIRRGEFSTGTAIERISAWVPDRKIAFDVITDPPAMHELSPYSHVNAPHVRGYFRTTKMTFEIVPVGNRECQLVEHTEHELRLDPVLYWMPFARWIIHENNMRVLTHIRDQATAVKG